MGKVIRYSEAFKIGVVRDLERGRFKSPGEAAEAHGIRGMSTVSRWVRQYGRGHLLKEVVRVSKRGEPSEIKRLKERVRQLEGALADAYMDSALDRAYFKRLCKEMDIDPEAFKKKHGAELSEKLMKMRERTGE
ncbi:MAG: transposase [Planctomycetota bacterium]|jgi:transposase-like protein